MEQLTNLLLSIDNKANFATDGVIERSPFPGLNIHGVGPISLPLCDGQAKKIIEVASKAPYGLGEKTIIDENVR